MKNVLLVSVTCFILTLSAYGQCVSTASDPCVSIHQSTIDRAARAADELIEARNVIAEFTKERAASQAERAAAAKVIEGLNQLVATKDRIEVEQNKIIKLYVDVVAMQQTIIEKLEKRLSAPKSGFQKLLEVLKRVGDIAVGVAIGRVF